MKDKIGSFELIQKKISLFRSEIIYPLLYFIKLTWRLHKSRNDIFVPLLLYMLSSLNRDHKTLISSLIMLTLVYEN